LHHTSIVAYSKHTIITKHSGVITDDRFVVLICHCCRWAACWCSCL